MSGSTLSDAEVEADAIVALLLEGETKPEPVIARLRASPRPYFTWAAAWAVLAVLAERRPENEALGGARDALRAVERAASALDGRVLARS